MGKFIDLPLWKMMEFVSWDDEYAQYIYIYMEKKRQNSLNVMFQTTNQIHVFVSILQDHP
jgi:hypothetical protein